MTLVIVLFSVIQTFADFQLVYVLTGGGPANATQLFATYAYQLGVGTGLLSEGATIVTAAAANGLKLTSFTRFFHQYIRVLSALT